MSAWPRAAALAAAAAILGAGCGHDPVPLVQGLEPLEPVSEVQWPQGTPADPYPEAISFADAQGGPTYGPGPGYSYGHARAYLAVPVADVWQAMQPPQGAQVANYPERADVDCEAVPGTQPQYPLSMQMRKTPKNPLGRAFWFDITWIGGTLPDSGQPPTRYNLAYQITTKPPGNAIRVMVGTIDARQVADGVTGLEIVRHIDAHGESGESARDWIGDFYLALKGQVHAASTPATAPPVTCSVPPSP